MEGWSLVAAAGLMGLAGLPHCAAMCAAPCTAAAGRGPPSVAARRRCRATSSELT